MKQPTENLTPIEKVELVQDLLATFESGIEPEPEVLRRASELGIDVDAMRVTYNEHEDTDNY